MPVPDTKNPPAGRQEGLGSGVRTTRPMARDYPLLPVSRRQGPRIRRTEFMWLMLMSYKSPVPVATEFRGRP